MILWRRRKNRGHEVEEKERYSTAGGGLEMGGGKEEDGGERKIEDRWCKRRRDAEQEGEG